MVAYAQSVCALHADSRILGCSIGCSQSAREQIRSNLPYELVYVGQTICFEAVMFVSRETRDRVQGMRGVGEYRTLTAHSF